MKQILQHPSSTYLFLVSFTTYTGNFMKPLTRFIVMLHTAEQANQLRWKHNFRHWPWLAELTKFTCILFSQQNGNPIAYDESSAGCYDVQEVSGLGGSDAVPSNIYSLGASQGCRTYSVKAYFNQGKETVIQQQSLIFWRQFHYSLHWKPRTAQVGHMTISRRPPGACVWKS